MRAVFDHSWRLLTAREQTVMLALSVFRGGFTRQAARTVAGATIRELRTLVDRSLVQPADDGRYEIHELLRQYASEKLARSPKAQAPACCRHAAFYAAALKAWSADLKGQRQHEALLEIDAEYDNCLTGWKWAAAHMDAKTLGQAVEGLGLYCERRGRHREAQAIFRETGEALMASGILTTPDAETALPLVLMMLRFRARARWLTGHTDEAYDLVARGLQLAEQAAHAEGDTRSAHAALLWVQGSMDLLTGRGDPRQPLGRAEALARAAGDRWRLANALVALGSLEESVSLRRALGDRHGLAESYRDIGWHLSMTNRAERGEKLIRESLDICRALRDPVMIGDSLIALALACVATGRFAEAEAPLRERIAINDEIGVPDYKGRNYLAKVVCGQGRYDEARAILDQASQMAQETGVLYGAALCKIDYARLAIVAGAYEEAMRLTRESAAAYAGIGSEANVDHARLLSAFAARGLGQHAQARRLVAEGLQIAADHWDLIHLIDTLPAAALLLLDRGETARAIETFELARTLPFIGHDAWAQDVVGRPIREATEDLPPDVSAAARERGRARDLQATCRDLAEEFEKMDA
jgi:tetratricopeptide (TPR) repeat protein